MEKMLPAVLTLLVLAGCQCPGQQATDPFFGRTTVPPPATGTVGPGAADPYYQQPPGQPLQPQTLQPQPLQPQPLQPQPVQPQTLQPPPGYSAPVFSAPGTPTPPPASAYGPTSGYGVPPGSASPTYAPGPSPAPTPATGAPSGAPPAGVAPPSGYSAPGGSGYRGTPTTMDWRPSIIRIPTDQESATSPADRPAESVAQRPPIYRTLQPQPRPSGSEVSAVAPSQNSATPTPAEPPRDIMELPPAKKSSDAL